MRKNFFSFRKEKQTFYFHTCVFVATIFAGLCEKKANINRLYFEVLWERKQNAQATTFWRQVTWKSATGSKQTLLSKKPHKGVSVFFSSSFLKRTVSRSLFVTLASVRTHARAKRKELVYTGGEGFGFVKLGLESIFSLSTWDAWRLVFKTTMQMKLSSQHN